MRYLKSKLEIDELLKMPIVLVDFYADWCGPCKALEPVLEELQDELNIEIVKVNVDNFMSFAREQKVLSIPTIKIFKNGKVLKEKTGLMTKDELKEFIGSEYLK